MNASKKAKHLRRACGASGYVDVEKVAALLGLKIDPRDFRARGVDEIEYRGNVAVAGHLKERERRWAIAHAIGHVVLHGKGNQVWLRTCSGLGGKLEQEAEEFAYALLVDEREARREGLHTLQELAGYFEVPPERVAMQGRLW